MTASVDKKTREELIVLIARKLTEKIDAVTKSKEVSKEFNVLLTMMFINW